MSKSEEEVSIVPGNQRRVQKRRGARRKLFGKVAKERFLEALASNCNVQMSAEEAGFGVGVVYAHRLKDREFADKWWLALEQGAAKLVALRLQHDVARAEALVLVGDAPPEERTALDLLKLMTQLREHSRGLAGGAHVSRRPQVATLEETCRVLAKKLKAFGIREGVEERPGPAEMPGRAGRNWMKPPAKAPASKAPEAGDEADVGAAHGSD